MGKAASEVSTFASVALAAIWSVVLLLPGHWCNTEASDSFKLDAGLYAVYVMRQDHHGSAKAAAELTANATTIHVHGSGRKLREKAGKQIMTDDDGQGLSDGQKWLSSVQKRLCLSGPHEECREWRRIRWSSTVMLVLGCVCALTLILGASFLHYYWHVRPSLTGRLTAVASLNAAPTAAFLGVVQYAYYAQDLDHDDGGKIESAALGPAYFVALLLTVLSCIPIFITHFYAGMDERETQDSAVPGAEEKPSVGGVSTKERQLRFAREPEVYALRQHSSGAIRYLAES